VRRTATRRATDAGGHANDSARLAEALAHERHVTLELQRAILPLHEGPFDLPGLPVDTHVGRLARRLGLTKEQDPVKVEAQLDAVVAPEERGGLSLRLILHGRQVCKARAPRCDECVLADVCPSVGLAVPAPRPRAASGVRRT